MSKTMAVQKDDCWSKMKKVQTISIVALIMHTKGIVFRYIELNFSTTAPVMIADKRLPNIFA